MNTRTKVLALSTLITASAISVATAQENTQIRVGVVGGMNYNYVDIATQKFIGNSGDAAFASTDFSQASGPGVYAGIMGEYDFNNVVGVQLRGTFDERCVTKKVGESELTPRLIYATIEPGVRFNISQPLGIHAMIGPSVSIPIVKKFDYSVSQSESPRNVEDMDLQNVNDVAFGGWAGFGMDIAINPGSSSPTWFVTPFVEGSYLYDQKEIDVDQAGFDDIWSTISGRAGVQVKIGW